jgi:uncharacterized protein
MTDTDQQQLLHREFVAKIDEEGDGRTIEARCVPYNMPADVADPPDWTPYREAFLPGAFAHQFRAADKVKVWLNFEHEQGLRGIVGHGSEFEDRTDGLYARFRVHRNTDGDKALQMVADGLLTGLSMEFSPLRSRTHDGIVQRVKARLDKVSLCRVGAYAAAKVLAVRQPPPTYPGLPEFDPQVAERAARFGIVIPDRLLSA